MSAENPAEQALHLLFKKLHPHLEDASHALDRGEPAAECLKRHQRLHRARHEVVELLGEAVGRTKDVTLAEVLGTLAANLTPLGENYQQNLILTQLCLEEAPQDLVPFVPEGCVASCSWGKRMVDFLARLEEPSFRARVRWKSINLDIGDDLEE